MTVFCGGMERFRRIPIEPSGGEAGVDHARCRLAMVEAVTATGRHTRSCHTNGGAPHRRKTDVCIPDRDSIPRSSRPTLMRLRAPWKQRRRVFAANQRTRKIDLSQQISRIITKVRGLEISGVALGHRRGPCRALRAENATRSPVLRSERGSSPPPASSACLRLGVRKRSRAG